MTVTIGRRELLAALGGAAAAWPLAARAQQRGRVRRIGALMALAANDPDAPVRVAAFAQGLQELGWTVGENVRIDYRWAASEALVMLDGNRVPRRRRKYIDADYLLAALFMLVVILIAKG